MNTPESRNKDGRVVDIQCLSLDDLGLQELVDLVRTARRRLGIEIE